MAEKTDERRKSDSRLLALAVAVLGQAATGIWWAASITAEQRHTTEALAALQSAVYTKTEARADFRNVELQVVEITRRVSSLEERKGPR